MFTRSFWQRTILLPSCLFLCSQISAQELAQVSGKVLDGVTGQPIPFASIYFNNTSIGTVADSAGIFLLKKIPTHYSDLVFSSIGYESFTTRISLSAGQTLNMNARLKPSKKVLGEIVVKAKRDNQWKKYYDQFIKEFIGTGPNASQCEIRNAGVLNFELVGEVLKASADVPLRIYNQALGYLITVNLEQFELAPETYRISFRSQFQLLIPRNSKEEFRWQVNRNRAYKGSLRHFLQSVIEKKSRTEGFRVYRPVAYHSAQHAIKPNEEVTPDVLEPLPVTNGFYQLMKKGVYEIHYLNKYLSKAKRLYASFPHPVSVLEVSDEYLLCPFTGILKSNSNSVISGQMSMNRLADNLPDDYDPIPDEGKAYLFRFSNEIGSIAGVVLDSVSQLPVPEARVFINNSSYATYTDYKGRFELKRIPEGAYTIVAAKGRYAVEGKKIVVAKDSVTQTEIRVPIKVVEPWEQFGVYQGNPTVDLKRMYISTRFINWHTFFTRIDNTNTLEIKFLRKNILMRTNDPLEIIDTKTGYRINYYLKGASIPRSRKGKLEINGFACFDTLTAKSFREREKWIANRDEVYLGSLDHFMRSLVDGRTNEEGFEIYAPDKGSKKPKRLEGDSLLLKANGKVVFEMRLPRGASANFDHGKMSKLSAIKPIQITSRGTIFNENELTVKGPMSRKAIPDLPANFVSTSESITDPKVWVFVKQAELMSLQNMREKPYVHTDKDYYYPGERIWFKIYMRYGSINLKDSLSKVLYTELIDSDKKIIKSKVLKIENGMSWGDIVLPDTPGNYFIRAYTRWSLNFGNEGSFIKVIPVLRHGQNMQFKNQQESYISSDIVIEADKVSYKPREKITLKIKITEGAALKTSNLSVSVTDMTRALPVPTARTIKEDSITQNKMGSRYKRITSKLEHEFGYECNVEKTQAVRPATVIVSAVQGNQTVFATPNLDSRFRFKVDFYDTASFIFRANAKNGTYAGRVLVTTQNPPSVDLPAVPEFSLNEDVRPTLTYPRASSNEKVTILDEVIVHGKRVVGSPKKVFTTSLVNTPDHMYGMKELDPMEKSVQDPTAFWTLMVDKIPGARPSFDHLILIRRVPASFRVNNVPYSREDILGLSPMDIAKIEVYQLQSLINIYLKTGAEKMEQLEEFDRYTLSGYATPTKFHSPDYSKSASEEKEPDLRATIFWEPNLMVDAESVVTFYAADILTKYRIVVQGLTETGKPVYGEARIEIKDK